MVMIGMIMHTQDSTMTGPQIVFWTGLSVCIKTLSLLGPNFYHYGWEDFCNDGDDDHTQDSTVTGPQTVFWTGLSVCAKTLSLLGPKGGGQKKMSLLVVFYY